jgi:Na+-transporting NADH:ubiquinone oxidoreductase subunit NqrA
MLDLKKTETHHYHLTYNINIMKTLHKKRQYKYFIIENKKNSITKQRKIHDSFEWIIYNPHTELEYKQYDMIDISDCERILIIKK